MKKFLARTLPEAMAQVKVELGPDAVILHTHAVSVGGIFGLFGTRMIEVMAAVEEADQRVGASHLSQSQAAGSQSRDRRGRQAWPTPQFPSQPVALAPAPMPVSSALSLLTPSEPLQTMPQADPVKDWVSLSSQTGRVELELKGLLTALAGRGVDDQAGAHLVSRVRDQIVKTEGSWADVMPIARELMRADLGKVEPLDARKRVVALVGPTGVGKTTTLAKLAAHFALGQRLQVALITADTYRVSAVDQLRTYSDILGVPLEVAYDAAEMTAAVGRHRNRDLVLVDTAGRSPRNAIHMGELQEYLKALNPDAVYLVMSLTCSFRDAVSIVDRHLPLGFDRFLFTKWDEAVSPGLVYNMVHKYKRPLSYITNGQNVPDDIEIAHPDKITQAILGD